MKTNSNISSKRASKRHDRFLSIKAFVPFYAPPKEDFGIPNKHLGVSLRCSFQGCDTANQSKRHPKCFYGMHEVVNLPPMTLCSDRFDQNGGGLEDDRDACERSVVVFVGFTTHNNEMHDA